MELWHLAVPITVIWIVAVTNSVNLIDGLDVWLTAYPPSEPLSMLIIALLMGDLEIAVITAALVGACVGFIPYNRIRPRSLWEIPALPSWASCWPQYR